MLTCHPASPFLFRSFQKSSILNWLDQRNMDFIACCFHHDGVDNNVYRPSTFIYRYIDWTFPASFTAVVTSFLLFYFTICVIFGLLLLAASRQYPECVVASGAPFGETPHTAFSDAVALSWTTFTTVVRRHARRRALCLFVRADIRSQSSLLSLCFVTGVRGRKRVAPAPCAFTPCLSRRLPASSGTHRYGMTYTSTASDFGGTAPHQCSLVVFLHCSSMKYDLVMK